MPTLTKHQAVLDTFLPLLTPDNGETLVVHTELVKIGHGVLEYLQSNQVCGNTKRESVLDLEESHGTLLEDLTADPSMLLLDFKVRNSIIFSVLKIAQMVVTVSYSTMECKYLSNLRSSSPSSEITESSSEVLSSRLIVW